MFLLYDSEIKVLGKRAEDFIKHQRQMMPLLNSHERYKSLIVEETPFAIAQYLLREHKHYLEGDLDRLTKEIQTNLSNMDWFNNNC